MKQVDAHPRPDTALVNTDVLDTVLLSLHPAAQVKTSEVSEQTKEGLKELHSFSDLIHLEKLSKEDMEYSSPRLVEDWMEELIVGLLLVENAWCQKQSWSFMHLLCSGMVGFGLRRKLGTAGTERHSPPSSSSMAGGILVLSVGFVMFSTVVFLGDLEIYFLVPVSRQ